ncbi:hypothetical protein C8F01DRAFT_1243426 [Mycena amicta]|nr:hypothetical protein C8F01DRAFT_1243426 [Mycena amicta]
MASTGLLALVLGFSLRVLLLSLHLPYGSAAFLGIFEGCSLHRTLLTDPLLDTIFLGGLRLLFDLVFTQLHFLSLLSALALAFLLSDAASRTHPDDVRRFQRRSTRFLRSVARAIAETDVWQKATSRSEPTVRATTPVNDPIPPVLHLTPVPFTPSHRDELLTPSSLAPSPFPRNQSPPVFTLPNNDEESDELQTPLELNIVGLPSTSVPLALVREPSEEHLEAEVPPENIPPELDILSPRTELSVLSNVEAKAMFARAESMRKDARDAEEEKRQLELQLQKALQEQRTKDVFLLRRDIESVEKKINELHAGAARRYFRSTKLSSPEDASVDVHGLFIPEAIKMVETALHEALLAGATELKVIVGKGKHSKNGRAKLKPAIMEEMERCVDISLCESN